MPKGIIVKGIGGFYYVKTEKEIIECKARGKFRKDAIVPMVGDYVEISLSEQEISKGSIEQIMPRSSCLIRPPVSNIQQLLIVAAVQFPEPNLFMLDKLIAEAETQNIQIAICFNKIDLSLKQGYQNLDDIYEKAGYEVFYISALTGEGILNLHKILRNKITALAGPSGVGKSSLINSIFPYFNLQTGEISEKIERGKHTTRHVELLELQGGGYIVDTPGFSSIDLTNIKAHELSYLFKEFIPYANSCKFRGCAHTAEPKCAVKDATEKGKIARSRYENYLQLYKQLKDVKEWK